VRHRLNVMQGGGSMAPPVARCSNGSTPCWRMSTPVIGSPMFLRARVAFARAHLCQESASGARAFARVLRGFERIPSPTSTAMRMLPSHAQSGKWNWPRQDKSGLRPC
jgi:hypothetical protein